jgi:L-rhamnose 1-dehydrogenase
MTLLSGKIVCITGASRGIGRACALEVVKYGARGLILHYFGDADTTAEMDTLREEVAKLSPEAKVVAVPGDISDAATSAKASLHLQYIERASEANVHSADRG